MLTCIQCEKPFIFTATEQERFASHGFDTPKRCPDCRRKKSKISETNGARMNKGNKKKGWRREYALDQM